MAPAPYPLVFEPFLLEKVWGGDRLSRFGKHVAAGARVGESWELADLSSTSASGAGGGAFRSVIANGGLKGRTLHEAAAVWGGALMGSARLGAGGDFPLLVKLLDASENLSVQVHPSPAYAAAHAEAHLKTECWYILDAEPGSVIYKGVKAGVTRESFAAHIKDGTVVSDMVAVAAVPGDCHALPSGTVHALGAGVLVAEVQTPSDTTFRVFDWGRSGRALHIAESLECIGFGGSEGARERGSESGGGRPTRLDEADRWTTLVENEFFTIDEVRLPDAEPRLFELGKSGRGWGPLVLIVVAGAITVGEDTGAGARVGVGGTVLVPAGSRMAGWRPRAEGGTRVLAVGIGR